MKIKNVKVRGLFGVFNHEIELNALSRITIIIGENGLGKTVLLEMINSFFKGKYEHLAKTEFQEVCFEFEDLITWNLTKIIENGQKYLIINQNDLNGSFYEPVRVELNEYRSRHLMANQIARENPFLRRIAPDQWEDRRMMEVLNSEEVVARYGEFDRPNFRLNKLEFPSWFNDRRDTIKVSLIETQRLILLDNKNERHSRQVQVYAQDLRRQINSSLTKSTELSSILDRTYPNRLIKRLKAQSSVNIDNLQIALINLEQKRSLLDSVGLIETVKDSSLLQIDHESDGVVLDVLMLYVEDSFAKLETFDALYNKISIFRDIINKRFKHKKVHIDKEYGFLFQSTIIRDKEGNQQIIPLPTLSSGEQNELILFYSLLFKTEPNSLILIDEPEVSLHISWQTSFIEDLRLITELNNLDVIIATHSPDIIANNWDLRVELLGLE